MKGPNVMMSRGVASLFLLTLILGNTSAAQAQVRPVLRPGELCSDQRGPALATFEDASLEAAIRAGLSLDAGRDLTCSLLSGLTDPTAQNEVAELAMQATRRLRAGEDFATVRDALGSHEISPLPDTLLPAKKLRDYVGPTALRSTLLLEDGAVSDPVRSGMGYHVLWRVQSEPDHVSELESIEPLVRAEWRRRIGDEALRAYLDELRGNAEVAVASELR